MWRSNFCHSRCKRIAEIFVATHRFVTIRWKFIFVTTCSIYFMPDPLEMLFGLDTKHGAKNIRKVCQWHGSMVKWMRNIFVTFFTLSPLGAAHILQAACSRFYYFITTICITLISQWVVHFSSMFSHYLLQGSTSETPAVLASRRVKGQKPIFIKHSWILSTPFKCRKILLAHLCSEEPCSHFC